MKKRRNSFFVISLTKNILSARGLLFLFLYISNFGFFFESAFAGQVIQPITITGIITDATTGEPIPGVNIYSKTNPTRGTISDFNGMYTIDVSDRSEILVFSYMGYLSEEIPVSDRETISVALMPAIEQLGEVVVIGYGTQRKQSVVGAVATASGEDIKRMNVSEISNSLTGMVTGLVTIQQNSLPGSSLNQGSGMEGSTAGQNPGTQIYIRGRSTWSGGQPLILVDGIERRMDEVDPNEVSSVSVLKDASATAVFGVRGANGVILITTKRGRVSKPNISFDGQYSMSMVSKLPKVLNSYEANLLKNYAIINEVALREDAWDFYKPQQLLEYYRTGEYPDAFPDTDWPSELMRNAANAYRFNTNISGGTNFVKYFGSMGYINEGGIMKGEDVGQGYSSNFGHDRFNFRSNLDFQFSPTTTVSLNLAGIYAITTDPGYNDNNIRAMAGIYRTPSDLFPVQYSDGVYANDPSILFQNPYVEMNFSGLDRSQKSQVLTDLKIDQKLDIITPGLSFGATASYDNDQTNRGPAFGKIDQAYKYIKPEIIFAQSASDSAGSIIWTIPSAQHGYNFVPPPGNRINESFHSLRRQLFYQFSLDYDRYFGRHQVTALALMNRMENAAGSNFLRKREDWVGRITYNYDDRYLLEANAGYNGSEKFDRKYRFGFFPSIAGGWIISNEQFFQNTLPWWNTLKIRYSAGFVGSDGDIPPWQYVSTWTTSDAMMWFGQPPGGTGYQTTFEGETANPHARWETTVKHNLGIETGFLNDRLLFSLEYFTDDRSDILIAANARTSNDIVGANLPAANIGKTETRGFEADLVYRYFSIGTGLGITQRLSYASAIDKTLFRDDPPLRPSYQKAEGYPIGQTRSLLDNGIMHSWDDIYTSTLLLSNQSVLPGDFSYIDFNSDGIINNEDRVPWGFPGRPQHSYTYNLALNYKGIGFSALFYGVFNVTNNQSFETFRDLFSIVYPWNMNESWVPELDNTHTARDQSLRFISSRPQTGRYDLIDGSYLRLKNIEVSYQLPKSHLDNIGLANMRVYITGYNIFLWTREEWREDREGQRFETSYPMLKRFTFGLTMGL
jgi:TonB-linked SusC/RagA family outer membrane protein